MSFPKYSIPFKTDDVYNGLAEIDGMMHADSERILLEFQVKDALFGVVKSAPKALTIPYSVLREVEYKRNFFVSKFKLHVTSMEILGKFPNSKDGIIAVKIKRKLKESALEMESFIRLHHSEYRLRLTGDQPEPTPFFE